MSSTMTATPDQPMLVATDIHRHFEGMRAVDGVSLEVLPGKITGLIGPNGAGKSTFLAVLAGTLPATSGKIVLDGEDITRVPAYQRARRRLVRTFQLPSEFAQLTVLENLLVAAPSNRGDSLFGALMGKRYWGEDEHRLIDEARVLLKRFGMSAKESDYAGTNQATAASWQVADIDQEIAALKEKGITFEQYDLPGVTHTGDVHTVGGLKAAWFKDPDGNILNLVNRD